MIFIVMTINVNYTATPVATDILNMAKLEMTLWHKVEVKREVIPDPDRNRSKVKVYEEIIKLDCVSKVGDHQGTKQSIKRGEDHQ